MKWLFWPFFFFSFSSLFDLSKDEVKGEKQLEGRQRVAQEETNLFACEEVNLFHEVERFLKEAERLYDEGKVWELRSLTESFESLPIALPNMQIFEQLANRVPGGKYSSLLVVSIICRILAYAVSRKEEAEGYKNSNHHLRLIILAEKCQDEANHELREHNLVQKELERMRIIKSDLRIVIHCDSLAIAMGYR